MIIYEQNTALTWGSTPAESVTIGSTQNSNPVKVDRSTVICVQATIASAAALNGTLKLQATIDKESTALQGRGAVTGISNWVDVADSTVTVTADGTTMWNVAQAGWRWVRLVYTSSVGTASLSGRVQLKGV
jgi:hypothetical protein